MGCSPMGTLPQSESRATHPHHGVFTPYTNGKDYPILAVDGRFVRVRSSIPPRPPIRHANMKRKPFGLSQRYVTALRNYLKPASRGRPSDAGAAELGREALRCGWDTLQLAQLHQHAVITLNLSSTRGLLQRAERFFTKANALIEATHRAARDGKIAMLRLQVQLRQRTTELAVTHRQLQRDADRQQVLKRAFVQREPAPERGLAESLQLQTLLRQLTHRVIAAQEDERTKISHELQDEIAQSLLGIQVRLLTLKQVARGDRKHLKNQIASAQLLVVNSAKSVRRFARKLNSPHQTFSGRPHTTP